MRPLSASLILASVLALTVSTAGLLGCRADTASKRSSEIDARSNDVSTAPSALDPSPTPTTTAASSIDSADHRPRIVCFGDSLTAGHGVDPGLSYPDFLQKDLDREGYPYRVINRGISGNTTKDGIDRLPSILALKPNLVIVEFGGNDGLRGLPIESSRANLDRILSTLRASNIPFVLAGITLPPDYGPDYIQHFNQTYTLLAAKYHVHLLPFLLQGVFGINGMMQPDRTHATAAGNQIVAENVLSLIKPLLKK